MRDLEIGARFMLFLIWLIYQSVELHSGIISHSASIRFPYKFLRDMLCALPCDGVF